MSRRRNGNREADLAFKVLAQLLRRSSPTTLALAAAVLLLLVLASVFLTREQGPAPPPGAATTDWYEVYFTSPVYPTNKDNYKGGLDTHLVRLLNQATSTVDVAVYDFDLANVAAALAAAQDRGVRVRLVTDGDTLANPDAVVRAALDALRRAGIPIVADQRGAIMHHKFTVVDREWVQTGSWNYTVGDTYRLNNHLILIHSRELAENYTAEFEKMFVHQQFGPNKAKGVPYPVLTIGGARVQNYFAPQDRVAGHLIAAVRAARQSIHFLAFSFTHDDLGRAIRDQAKAGLTVGGVFETTGSNTPYSEYGPMKQAGLDVHTDGNPYAMHHKVLLLDERTVVLGSFNFSDSADKANDENVLIVEDAGLAQAFQAEYDRVLAQAKHPPAKK
jgi:phosphatidylserine/phosphatidylglycerophosphate/cardiolipin synthase-like enzyme